MNDRTLVFVDTSYLLASFYNSWETVARAQLEIDVPEVVEHLDSVITAKLGQPVHRQYWYDGIPDSGPHRYQRALRTCPGVQLRAGQLIEWGERRTQKAVDTRLVADMIISAGTGNFLDMVLVSGDADMIPGVEEAVRMGSRVHLFGFGRDSVSSALRFACDTANVLDPREDFRDTMRLEALEGPLPTSIPATVKEEEEAKEPEQQDPDWNEEDESRPTPSMMAPKRKLRSRYVPLPDEVWNAGSFQAPFDVGQQYATWWYTKAATDEQLKKAHLLTGGGLPAEIDRPLLQFACETLHEYTLGETQRIQLRDGFHSGIRALLTDTSD